LEIASNSLENGSILLENVPFSYENGSFVHANDPIRFVARSVFEGVFGDDEGAVLADVE